MALFEDGLKGSTGSILVILGVALAAPIVLPAVASVSRPLAKALIKGYLALADTVKTRQTRTEAIRGFMRMGKGDGRTGARPGA